MLCLSASLLLLFTSRGNHLLWAGCFIHIPVHLSLLHSKCKLLQPLLHCQSLAWYTPLFYCNIQVYPHCFSACHSFKPCSYLINLLFFEDFRLFHCILLKRLNFSVEPQNINPPFYQIPIREWSLCCWRLKLPFGDRFNKNNLFNKLF